MCFKRYWKRLLRQNKKKITVNYASTMNPINTYGRLKK